MLTEADKRFMKQILDELKAKMPVRSNDLKRFETLIITRLQDENAEQVANDSRERDRLLREWT